MWSKEEPSLAEQIVYVGESRRACDLQRHSEEGSREGSIHFLTEELAGMRSLQNESSEDDDRPFEDALDLPQRNSDPDVQLPVMSQTLAGNTPPSEGTCLITPPTTPFADIFTTFPPATLPPIPLHTNLLCVDTRSIGLHQQLVSGPEDDLVDRPVTVKTDSLNKRPSGEDQKHHSHDTRAILMNRRIGTFNECCGEGIAISSSGDTYNIECSASAALLSAKNHMLSGQNVDEEKDAWIETAQNESPRSDVPSSEDHILSSTVKEALQDEWGQVLRKEFEKRFISVQHEPHLFMSEQRSGDENVHKSLTQSQLETPRVCMLAHSSSFQVSLQPPRRDRNAAAAACEFSTDRLNPLLGSHADDINSAFTVPKPIRQELPAREEDSAGQAENLVPSSPRPYISRSFKPSSADAPVAHAQILTSSNSEGTEDKYTSANEEWDTCLFEQTSNCDTQTHRSIDTRDHLLTPNNKRVSCGTFGKSPETYTHPNDSIELIVNPDSQRSPLAAQVHSPYVLADLNNQYSIMPKHQRPIVEQQICPSELADCNNSLASGRKIGQNDPYQVSGWPEATSQSAGRADFTKTPHHPPLIASSQATPAFFKDCAAIRPFSPDSAPMQSSSKSRTTRHRKLPKLNIPKWRVNESKEETPPPARVSAISSLDSSSAGVAIAASLKAVEIAPSSEPRNLSFSHSSRSDIDLETLCGKSGSSDLETLGPRTEGSISTTSGQDGDILAQDRLEAPVNRNLSERKIAGTISMDLSQSIDIEASRAKSNVKALRTLGIIPPGGAQKLQSGNVKALRTLGIFQWGEAGNLPGGNVNARDKIVNPQRGHGKTVRLFGIQHRASDTRLNADITPRIPRRGLRRSESLAIIPEREGGARSAESHLSPFGADMKQTGDSGYETRDDSSLFARRGSSGYKTSLGSIVGTSDHSFRLSTEKLCGNRSDQENHLGNKFATNVRKRLESWLQGAHHELQQLATLKRAHRTASVQMLSVKSSDNVLIRPVRSFDSSISSQCGSFEESRVNPAMKTSYFSTTFTPLSSITERSVSPIAPPRSCSLSSSSVHLGHMQDTE
ncbi:hypothetical protein DFS34DRAFT_618089 [Phlyctochytrium arcticum]|nr:hypothetical protein DFS34DRAFT_618089 [Phlyctochytrium arcticum]